MENATKKYKSFLRRYKLQDQKIGEMFGYATPGSWQSSHRRKKVIEGIVKIVSTVEGDLADKIKLLEKIKRL